MPHLPCRTIALVIALAFIAACAPQDNAPPASTIAAERAAAEAATERVERQSPQTIDEGPAAAESSNTLAMHLYGTLGELREGNVFFSPLSIGSALAMTWEGARGETAEQMRRVLAVPVDAAGMPWPRVRYHVAMGRLTERFNRADQPFELTVANALWAERTTPFRDAFLTTVQPHYQAGFEQVDFRNAPDQARRRINTWVEQQTSDRIADLLPAGSIHGDTRLVLTNAIYFKAEWAMPFDEHRTQDRDFHLADGQTVQTPTMHHDNLPVAHMTADGVQAIELPYRGGDMAMVILLPDEPAGLPALDAQLDADALQQWLGELERKRATLYLPRFGVETEYNLNDALAELGMPLAFARGRADFTGLSDAPRSNELHITNVVHKAFVDVDEQGTEAAAATGVVAGVLSMPAEPALTVRVDRPFIFMIRDRETGTILFLGRVVDPR